MGRLKTVVCPACGVSRSTKAEGRQRLACRGCGQLYAIVEAKEAGAIPETPPSPAADPVPASQAPTVPPTVPTGVPARERLGAVRVEPFAEVHIPAPRPHPVTTSPTSPSAQVNDMATSSPSAPPATSTGPGDRPAPPPSTTGDGRRRPAGGPGYYLARTRAR